jgi:hypothetical protein
VVGVGTDAVEILLRHLVVTPAHGEVDRRARDVEHVDARGQALISEDASSGRQIQIDPVCLIRIDDGPANRALREADSAGESRAAAEVAHVDVESAPRQPGVVVVVPMQHALGHRSLRRRELLRLLIAGCGQRLRAAGVVVLRLRGRMCRSDRQRDDECGDVGHECSSHVGAPSLQFVCRDRCAREIAEIAREIRANALNHLHDTRSITLRTPLVAMSKLRISNHPARSVPNRHDPRDGRLTLDPPVR